MADMDFYSILALLQKEHPDVFGLLSKPGVFSLAMDMMKAEVAGQPWTTDQVSARLQATPYFQHTDANARAFDALLATDPATARQTVEKASRTIHDLESQLGVHLDDAGGMGSPAFAFLTHAVAEGWSADEIKYRLLASVNATHNGGEIAANAAAIKGLANDYGVPLSDQSTMHWATLLTQGAINQDGMKGYLVEQAKSLFPALSSALDKGITVSQYADPYKQIAVQQLGVNPETINWADPKWNQALNQIDPKTGQRVSMSLDQWTQTVRSDPRYGYDTTSQGKQAAAQLATQLLQKFGAA